MTIESIQQRLALMGATPDVQREMGNLFRTLRDPDGIYATVRTPEAVTPTTFEQFAKNKLLPNNLLNAITNTPATRTELA